MKRALRILHVSDLHMGQERGASRWRMRDVLGDAWRENLDDIARDGPVDLVCFTGDLAFSGQSGQYLEAGQAIEHILQRLGLDKSRFFCVPGNHDIDRNAEADAWRQLRDANDVRPEDFDPWIAGGRAPRGCDDRWRDAVLARRSAYDDWLTAFGLDRLHPRHHRHGRLGYRVTFRPGEIGNHAPLHIVGFDSAWLSGAGDEREQDNANLRLTREQVGCLLSDDNGDPLQGHAIGLVHHPFSCLIESESQALPPLMSRLGLGLLMHGHLHDLRMSRWSDPDHGLHVSSAGSQYQRNDVPNTIHLLDVELPAQAPLRPVKLWVRTWDGDGGHWYNDNKRYRKMVDGRLHLMASTSAPYTPTPGKFIGRTTELDALCAAMLPAAQGASAVPTLICCAIDGMPGVGKTRLAEEFIAEHWLKAYPPPLDTPVGDCVLRLVLAAGEDAAQARSADTLLRDLGDRLRLQGSLDDIKRDLPAALRHGPGGHPRLVLIENVDSEAQADQVVALVHRLPDCPVLVTARVRKFGGLAWKRVEVEPMRLQDAIDLLRNEAAAAGDDACIPTIAQAQRLAETLGRLPLALHIAASHLGLGKTPDEFLAELRGTGLDLAPAQQGDHGLQVDRARAILRSSFDLSWRTWCQGAGAQPEWQQALIALAHGPAADVGESLGAAITALPPTAYGPCVIAAGRLSLLEWEWAGAAESRERRVRLHALIAEFLRRMPVPEAATVMARIGDWFAPRVSDHDPETMGSARREVQLEPAGLLHWLAVTRLDEKTLSIVAAVKFAIANGPYGAWLACFKAAIPHAGETQRGLDLAWAISMLAHQSGDPELAINSARANADLAKRLGDDYEYAAAQGQMANILQARGELEEALRIRRDEQMPVYERLGNARARAITQGQIADILQARGELEEALRIRREEVMPVYERLGELRERAIAQGKIADILQARGELEEALRIHREEALPVFERQGDTRSCAITQGQIADILQARGELAEALLIRREELLPVFERLGDVRSRAITQGKIADILDEYGDREEAIRIYREEVLPAYERLGVVHMLLVDRTNLAIKLLKRGQAEDGPEILTLLHQALHDAERLRLPEAATIRGYIAKIFGPDASSPSD
ncbi:metallophosphoesterase [Lysobacter brunescens]|uniref:Metallophosphoesterase n=1 Tax=Lysobacter brunescens TaxID=262323 RepID=A0ABW2Y7X0_9GAMM